GSWAVGTFHSTATLSSEGTCSLCELRFMHCLNIFLSHHGHSGWVGLIFCLVCSSNPNPRVCGRKWNETANESMISPSGHDTI
ncbi:hypothetical protein F4604DRAFT_1590437, partial [Suillus subluteus]